MTRDRWLVTAAAMAVGLALAGPAWATHTLQHKLQQQAPLPHNPCRPGWHVAGKVWQGTFACVPNKPAAFECLEGNEYYKKATRAGGVCEVGCQSIPKVK